MVTPGSLYSFLLDSINIRQVVGTNMVGSADVKEVPLSVRNSNSRTV